MAYVEIRGTTESSISFRLNGLDSGYEQSIRSLFWRIYRGTTLIDSQSEYLPNRITYSNTRTFSGLQPDTRYKIEAYITNIASGTYPNVTLYEYEYTDPTSGNPLYPPSFNIYSYDDKSVTITFSVPTGATECGIYIDYYGATLTSRDMMYSGDDGFATITETFSGPLEPDTRYWVAMDSYNEFTEEASALSSTKSFYTDPAPALPTPTFNQSETDTSDPTGTSIYVEANMVSNIDSYYYELWNSSLSTRLDYNIEYSWSNPGTTFTGLTANTSYYLRVKVRKAGWADSPWSGWYRVTTGQAALQAPTLDTSYTQKTHNTISVRVNTVTNAQYYYIELWNSTKTTRVSYQNTTSRTAYFSGLTAGTQYYIRVKVTATGYTESAWSGWYGATTTIAAGWNWQHSTLPGDPIALSASEWIAFQNRINQVRTGLGYSTYSFGTAEIGSGRPIKATHFNQAITALNGPLASANEMAIVYTGNPITSAKMIEMKDKLNSLIQ